MLPQGALRVPAAAASRSVGSRDDAAARTGIGLADRGASGNEQTTRGFSSVGLLIVDEAARLPDETYFAATPMLDPEHGRVMLLSTPLGSRGHFYEATRNPEWRTFTVPAEQVARLSPRFLREQERSLGAWFFDQEYRCVFLDPQSAAFASDDIEGAFREVETWDVLSSSAWT